MRTTFVLFACFFVALGACKDAPKREGISVPSPELSASAAQPAVPAPTATPLPAASLVDLDVPALKKKLGCVGDTRRSSCRILNEFGDASPFNPLIPSGEGRFIGNAYTVEKGVEKSELILVSVSQVPTSTVAPGELALKVGIGPVPDDKHDHGVKLVNALSHGDTVSKLNQAAPYVKAWKPSDAQGTMNTSGTSTRLVSSDAYLRLGTANKLLLVRLKPQGASGAAAEATLAELWASAW